ncbi:MAG: hypothetical protein WED05_11320 [Candidatus Atabeyarchaeum deiterrae]
MNLGENCRALLYSYLAGVLSLKRDIIPHRLQDFAATIQDIFKLGSKVIDGLITKTLCDRLNVDYAVVKDMGFQVAIEEIKRKSMI